MPFASLGLVPELVRAVAEEGYERPTPIQQETIPLALDGRDLIGSAQTGTGKTAAFMLPILQRLAPGPRNTLRALILVPTRELAEQVPDRMLDMGFAPDVRRILRELPTERQTMLFSATISPEVDALARTALNGHASVEIGRRAQAADGIEHVIVAVDKLQKRDVLAKILQAKPAGQTLVFTRTKYGADKLATFLKKSGIPAHALHGDKAQSHRTRTLEAFRRGVAEILVATDIAARGIDVDGIRMVVNFDVPADAEIYVHRVGRTARAGAQGLALTLLSPDEWLLMADIEKLIGQTFPREVIPGFEPSVAPMQPKSAKPAVPRRSITVRGRSGAAKRRR